VAVCLQVSQEEAPVDDGSGTIKIWRIENFEKADWPQVSRAAA
jgi:hypothetical protein